MELPTPFIKAEQEMRRAGIWPGVLYPLMKALGHPVRPFPYRPFLLNLTQTALWVSILFGIVMYQLFWQQKGIPVSLVIPVAVQFGLTVGFIVAIYSKWLAKYKRLSTWQSLSQHHTL